MIILMIIIFCEVARAPQAIFLPFLCARLSPELGETSEKGTKILIFSPAYRPEIVTRNSRDTAWEPQRERTDPKQRLSIVS